MFSGIVKSIGRVEAIIQNGTTLRFTISSPMSGELTIDQSISHNGVCLTIVKASQGIHEVDVVAETLSKTNFRHLKAGDFVNIEKSITPSTLLDGHLVQGHVDTTLLCTAIQDYQGSWNFTFNLPAEFEALVIPHGSVCLNGVSLTVARVHIDSFEVAIIPYTFENTTFKYVRKGDYVNVEFDLIGKYVLRSIELKNRL
jgi:riboflavin synthase